MSSPKTTDFRSSNSDKDELPASTSKGSTSANKFVPKMLFGHKLDNEIYTPWKEYYINYTGLKKLLKENVILQNNWNENDEQTFVSALDQNLEKVYSFQHEKFDEINNQLNKLQDAIQNPSNNFELNSFLNQLDEILSKAQELDHFQRLNYTGFIKIVKKHDRLHPNYSVKPLLNVRLKKLPFHSEDYSPLLYKISALFQFLRENYDINQSLKNLSSFNDTDTSNYQSFKFWIHPDNLIEAKTTILRHLPVLIYNHGQNGDEDEDEDDEDEEPNDPIINSLYFDNRNFELYNNKLVKAQNSSTLRIKWLGKLTKSTKLLVEKKCFDPSSENFNINERITVKPKNVNGLIKHDLGFLSKKSNKAEKEEVKNFADFIQEHSLQPVLRTVYKRTAFQIPGDDKIRITIDSNVNFIREDAFDQQRPIRDPEQWHRLDLDSSGNFEKFLRTGEYSKFPYSIMEIKVKKFNNTKKKVLWIEDLINSHLVKEIPNFSKFIHGIATLFLEDDNMDNIPFWFNELENDIKIDPIVFSENKINKQNSEDNLEKFKKMVNNANSLNLRKSFSGSVLLDEAKPVFSDNRNIPTISEVTTAGDESSDDLDYSPPAPAVPIQSLIDKLNVDSEDEEIELPPGVLKPETYIKNQGPLKIEPKVWLANERTFNRWLHVTTLLSSLTFIIYSSANKANSFTLSTILAYIYFGLTLFSGVWGYYIFDKRRNIIMERSDKPMDDMVGPLIVAAGLFIVLVVNFVFGFQKVYQEKVVEFSAFYQQNPGHHAIHRFLANLLN